MVLDQFAGKNAPLTSETMEPSAENLDHMAEVLEKQRESALETVKNKAFSGTRSVERVITMLDAASALPTASMDRQILAFLVLKNPMEEPQENL
jgi:hypothetical protein